MEKHLVRTILMTMASIGKVEYRIKDEFIGFYRDEVLFAAVRQDGLYFLNENSLLVKFEQPVDKLNIRFNLATAYSIAI